MKDTDQRIREVEAEIHVLDECLVEMQNTMRGLLKGGVATNHPDYIRAHDTSVRLSEKRTELWRALHKLLYPDAEPPRDLSPAENEAIDQVLRAWLAKKK